MTTGVTGTATDYKFDLPALQNQQQTSFKEMVAVQQATQQFATAVNSFTTVSNTMQKAQETTTNTAKAAVQSIQTR
jgi:hypothetical protein